MSRWRAWAVLIILLSACSSTSSRASPETTTEPSTSTTTVAQPGSRGEVRVVRQDATSSAVVMRLLETAGYDVIDLTLSEPRPFNSLEIAVNNIDADSIDLVLGVWRNDYVDEVVEDASAAQHLDAPMAEQFAPQGILVTKAWAEENEVTSMNQIHADLDLVASLDHDGNGRAEIYGCLESWTCDDHLGGALYLNDWTRFEQLKPQNFDSQWGEVLEFAQTGEPVLAYAWGSSEYYAQAELGKTMMWLSFADESVIDEEFYMWSPNPRDRASLAEAGELGNRNVDPATCIAGPDGCQLGWRDDSTLSAIGRKQWFEENPEATQLLNAIEFDVARLSDIAGLLEARYDDWGPRLEQSHGAAEVWVDANRQIVDRWLAAVATDAG